MSESGFVIDPNASKAISEALEQIRSRGSVHMKATYDRAEVDCLVFYTLKEVEWT